MVADGISICSTPTMVHTGGGGGSGCACSCHFVAIKHILWVSLENRRQPLPWRGMQIFDLLLLGAEREGHQSCCHLLPCEEGESGNQSNECAAVPISRVGPNSSLPLVRLKAMGVGFTETCELLLFQSGQECSRTLLTA